jgi:hypothetical protein
MNGSRTKRANCPQYYFGLQVLFEVSKSGRRGLIEDEEVSKMQHMEGLG